MKPQEAKLHDVYQITIRALDEILGVLVLRDTACCLFAALDLMNRLSDDFEYKLCQSKLILLSRIGKCKKVKAQVQNLYLVSQPTAISTSGSLASSPHHKGHDLGNIEKRSFTCDKVDRSCFVCWSGTAFECDLYAGVDLVKVLDDLSRKSWQPILDRVPGLS